MVSWISKVTLAMSCEGVAMWDKTKKTLTAARVVLYLPMKCGGVPQCINLI